MRNIHLEILYLRNASRYFQHRFPVSLHPGKSRSHSRFSSLDVYNNFMISRRCIYHRHQTFSHAVWNHSILPLYSMMILNQPLFYDFLLWWDYSTVRSIQKYSEKVQIHLWEQQIPSRQIVFQRKNLADPQILILTWLLSSRRLRPTSMYRKFLYRLQRKESHLDNFALVRLY